MFEPEPGEELLNGYDLSEDEAADGEEALNDLTDDEDGSGDKSVHFTAGQRATAVDE